MKICKISLTDQNLEEIFRKCLQNSELLPVPMVSNWPNWILLYILERERFTGIFEDCENDTIMTE